MRKMLSMLADRLKNGEDIVMVTVIASSGSTPRGAGSRMLVGKEGHITGTIGGGAVEYRSEHIAAGILKEKKSLSHDFSLTKDDVQNLGMICGGAVSVFFKYIPGGDEETLSICDRAENLFRQGLDIWLLSDMDADGKLGLYSDKEGYYHFDAPDWLEERLSRHPIQFLENGRNIYAEQINSSGKVYVFGCGHVAQELVPVLSHVGFRCVALDDRPEFASRALFPTADEVKLIDFEHISDYISVTEEDYVCVMTRGHAFDSVVQAQMLMTDACYIGVIGSKAKKAGVYARLKEEYGFDDAVFNRITSPIGLSIKAETPAEIAVSIAAQMIEIRASRNAQK